MHANHYVNAHISKQEPDAAKEGVQAYDADTEKLDKDSDNIFSGIKGRRGKYSTVPLVKKMEGKENVAQCFLYTKWKSKGKQPRSSAFKRTVT